MALIRNVQLACFPLSAGRGIQTLARITGTEGLSTFWNAENRSQPAPRLLSCSPGIKYTSHLNQPGKAAKFSHFVPVLRGHSSSLVCLTQCSYFHTQCRGLLAAKDGKPADRRGSKGQEKGGSVLMQFVERRDEPKQLTVGGKGELLVTVEAFVGRAIAKMG